MDVWASIALVFMTISVTLSLFAVSGHLRNYSKPYLQRYIIRILLMVPIYSLNAWFAMILPAAGLYLDSSREVYESFVIYSFMKYLLNFLHYDTNLQQYIDYKPGPRHIFPFCCLPTCLGGKPFMVRCKHGILQYVVIRPITTLVAFASQLLNFYGEGNYNPLSGYTYPVLLIINNISQIMAMYCLVIFYTGYRDELRPMQPLAKFFSIKLVVFFSFFQSVLISGLLEIESVGSFFGVLFPELNQDKVAIGRKVQEFLICFDMLIASIGHLFAFSHLPFTDESSLIGTPRVNRRTTMARSQRQRSDGGGRSCCEALSNLLDFSDEKSDVSEHFGHIFDRIRKIFSFKKPLPTIVSTNRMNVATSPKNQLVDDDWMQSDPPSGAENSARVQINANGVHAETGEHITHSDYQSM